MSSNNGDTDNAALDPMRHDARRHIPRFVFPGCRPALGQGRARCGVAGGNGCHRSDPDRRRRGCDERDQQGRNCFPPSTHKDADVDYLFAQVGVDKPSVDTAPSCGNILAGVGPFAIENGYVAAQDGETTVRVRNVNTGAMIDCVVQTPNHQVTYEGDTSVDGVPGTSAPIRLEFRQIAGGKTGRLLPTGKARDRVCGVDVSCVDLAMPMVLVAAESLGRTGYESKAELDADADLLDRLETIRRARRSADGTG